MQCEVAQTHEADHILTNCIYSVISDILLSPPHIILRIKTELDVLLLYIAFP